MHATIYLLWLICESNTSITFPSGDVGSVKAGLLALLPELIALNCRGKRQKFSKKDDNLKHRWCAIKYNGGGRGQVGMLRREVGASNV